MRHFVSNLARQVLSPFAGTICLLALALCPAIGQPPSAPSSSAPISITLDEAIHRAEASEPAFAAASGESRAAAIDRSIARAGLLPSVGYHNQGIYTQPNSHLATNPNPATEPTQIFIANNGVREYMSQAVVNETMGLAGFAAVRRADAAAARTAAELEIARRGLRATVVSLFYGSLAADARLAVADRAHVEAVDFTSLTTKREQARESAHADVVKAQLQEQQRQRDLSDAQVAAEKARLELGVLLFPDPRTPYSLAAPDNAPQLPTRDQVNQAAARNNPELKSALAFLKENNADVLAARAAYLPDIGLNYTYGIDAPQFAANGPDHIRNLGYSASVTVDIPVWDWFSTQHRIRQSEIRRDVAKVALTNTQRRLIARLDEAYSELVAARDQFSSLDSSVDTAAESLRLTRLRYTAGEATVLEVVDAQSSYVTAQNAREGGRVRYQAALADLETLTGTL